MKNPQKYHEALGKSLGGKDIPTSRLTSTRQIWDGDDFVSVHHIDIDMSMFFPMVLPSVDILAAEIAKQVLADQYFV